MASNADLAKRGKSLPEKLPLTSLPASATGEPNTEEWMSYNKPSTGPTDTGMWLEYALILILVVIVVAAIVPLIQPFIESQISQFCATNTTELFICKQ